MKRIIALGFGLIFFISVFNPIIAIAATNNSSSIFGDDIGLMGNWRTAWNGLKDTFLGNKAVQLMSILVIAYVMIKVIGFIGVDIGATKDDMFGNEDAKADKRKKQIQIAVGAIATVIGIGFIFWFF